MTPAPSANGNNASPPATDEPVLDTRDFSRALACLERLGKKSERAGATGAAKRIESAKNMIAEDSLTVSLEDLVRTIDPERVIDERADASGRLWRKKDPLDTSGALRDPRNLFSRLWGLRGSVRLAQVTRNIAALVPLIFTWGMLGWAAREYELDLHTVPADSGKPFLLLWQQGFTGGFLPFGWVAAIDAIFLFLVVALTWRVNAVERSAEQFDASVWDAVGELEEAMGYGASFSPTSAQDFLREMDKVVRGAYTQNRELADKGEEVLNRASEQLTSSQAKTQALIEQLLASNEALVQDHRALISEFSDTVRKTLASVREQSAVFIKDTQTINERVLEDLVRRQIAPLLTRMEDLLGQFRAEQESYTATVTGLAGSVTAIQRSAARLADDSQEFTGLSRSIAGSLQGAATAQERFAGQVQGSATSMTTAAASMTEVKDTLQAVLVNSAAELTGNLTEASASLAATQASLAATTAALRDAATELRSATASPAPPATPAPQLSPADIAQLRQAIAGLTQAVGGIRFADTPRRRWWRRRPPGDRPDGFQGQ